MSDLKEKLKSQDGFIAIVAMGIFALMTLYAITLTQMNVDTVNRVTREGNSITANIQADAGMEYLQLIPEQYEAGYNTGEIVCNYGNFAEEGQGTNPDFCQPLDYLTSGPFFEGKNIQFKLEIKGRAETSEKFGGDCAGAFNDCYVVPFPGTGTAGEENRCRVYFPIFDSNSANTLIGHNARALEEGGIEGEDGLKQIDYACNWNKLTFGSSIMDRAAIPFYYQTDDDTIISPFHSDPTLNGGTQAQNFIVRVRTPCLPCVYEDKDKITGVNRKCERGQDPTICYDYDQYPPERYELKVNGIEDDDVVVQWQLTGLCEEDGEDEECGLIQYVKYETGEVPRIAPEFSGISEGRINYDTLDKLAHLNDDQKHKLLYGKLDGIDTSTYERMYIKYYSLGKLDTIKQPFLTLFLSNKLISREDKNVPYLEYQILTDQPIGNQSTELQVTVNVDGNVFEKTIYQDQSKPLIDFAVQN